MSLDGVLPRTTENYKKFYDYLAQNYSRFTNIEDRSRVCKELEEVIYMLLLLILAEDDDTTDNPNDIGMLYDTLKVLVQLYNNVVDDKKGSELLQHPQVHKILGNSANISVLDDLDTPPLQQHQLNQSGTSTDEFYVGFNDFDFNPTQLSSLASIKSDLIKKEDVESEMGLNNNELQTKLYTTPNSAEMFGLHSTSSGAPSITDGRNGPDPKDLDFADSQFTTSQSEFSLNQMYNQYFPNTHNNTDLSQNSNELPDISSGARLIDEKESESLTAIIETLNNTAPSNSNNNSNHTSNSIGAVRTSNGNNTINNLHIASSPHHGVGNTMLANLDDHNDHLQLFGPMPPLMNQFEPPPYNSDFEF